jgi:hypothetical protein
MLGLSREWEFPGVRGKPGLVGPGRYEVVRFPFDRLYLRSRDRLVQLTGDGCISASVAGH